MSAVGASHVDAVFDFDAAVGVELVDFVEGYAEDEVHEDVENAGGFLCALTDPDFDVKFVGFLGAGDVSGGIFVVFLKDVDKMVCTSAVAEDLVEEGSKNVVKSCPKVDEARVEVADRRFYQSFRDENTINSADTGPETILIRHEILFVGLFQPIQNDDHQHLI